MIDFIIKYDMQELQNEIRNAYMNGYRISGGIGLINSSVTEYMPLYYVTLIKVVDD